MGDNGRKQAYKQAYFPMFFNLEGKQALVVGAGPIGMRRAAVLARFGAKVRVVAPDGGRRGQGSQTGGAGIPDAWITDVVWERRTFEPSDIDGCFLVIAAADDGALNDKIARLCRTRGIYVNHAGDQTQCDFYFPAIAMEGNVVVGLTSSGQDHGLVRRLAAKLRVWLEKESGKEEGPGENQA